MPIEPMLYIDPQAHTLQRQCPHCGNACYAPGFHCLRCERNAP